MLCFIILNKTGEATLGIAPRCLTSRAHCRAYNNSPLTKWLHWFSGHQMNALNTSDVWLVSKYKLWQSELTLIEIIHLKIPKLQRNWSHTAWLRPILPDNKVNEETAVSESKSFYGAAVLMPTRALWARGRLSFPRNIITTTINKDR